MRVQGSIWMVSLVAMSLLGAVFCCSQSPRETDRLTQEYGPELQMVYENYQHAVYIAYETGDTSNLFNTVTGYSLDSHLNAVETEDTKSWAEAWKVEIMHFRVHEYSADTATAWVMERRIGNIQTSDRIWDWTVTFQKEDGQWKVLNVETPVETVPWWFD